jgi:hypothetical protein
MQIHTATVKRFHEEFTVESRIHKGEDKAKNAIVITNNRTGTSLRFDVGGDCVIGAYNLVYTGSIVSISEKTVTIKEDHGTRLKRFTYQKFVDWNHNYDAERIAKRNADTMMSI